MGTVQFKVGSQNPSEIFVQRVGFCDLTYRNIVGGASSPTNERVPSCIYVEILEVKVTAKIVRRGLYKQ